MSLRVLLPWPPGPRPEDGPASSAGKGPARPGRRRWGRWVVAAVLGAAAAVALLAWQDRARARQARELLDADQPAEARARLRLPLMLHPSDPELNLLAARAARLTADLPAAEAHLQRCLRSQGGATEAVQLEFLLLRVQRGELDELAGTLIEWVEQGHPEAAAILETVARAYMQRLRYRPAYACLSRWIELCPDRPKPYQWRGWVLERLDQPRTAAEDYARALELDPRMIAVRLRIAEMLLEDNRAPEAVPHLEELIRQAPDRPDVQARLGMCRFHQGRPEEARRLLEAALPHLPDDVGLLVHLGKLDVQEGRGAEGEAHLRRAIAADPSDAEARYNLVAALELQGKTDEAERARKDYQQFKGWVDRANKLLREVADQPTARADDAVEIGQLLLHIGRERLGVHWLEQALERAPDHPTAHRLLADYYDTKGDSRQAESHRRHLPPEKPSASPAPLSHSPSR